MSQQTCKAACTMPRMCTHILTNTPCCSYECIRCGDKSRFDTSFEAADDESEAYAVMDNLKAAMANK